MLFLFFIVLQGVFLLAGIRDGQRTGVWRWSRFIFLLAFALAESLILFLPIYLIHDTNNRFFWPLYAVSWIVVTLNFVWMIRTVRRWGTTGSRTSS